MPSKIMKISLVLVCFLIVIQFIPLDLSNPPIKEEIQVPQHIADILHRSCYDCHSNETVWPWYSRVAPISWLVLHDVQEGREHLNFSNWGEYSKKEQNKQFREIWEVVEEGEMPPWIYLPAHPNAGLEEGDKRAIQLWLGY